MKKSLSGEQRSPELLFTSWTKISITDRSFCRKPSMLREGDTPQILQRRVMEEAEWIILPKAISLIAEGRVTIDENAIAHIRES